MSVVHVEHLSKSYGSVAALRDVSLEIPEGVTGLLGPNGAGKSTMLLCVLGLLRGWEGSVKVLGLDARTEQLAIRRRVGFMPESDAWLPNMTGIRAVSHLGRLGGLPPTEAMRRAHEVLWHVGLGEAIYRELREYSTGMRQRFKLAQAIVHDPEILFLDEPLGGMDPRGRDELLALIRDLSDVHGKHVVWSSHILPEVQKVADGVVILHQGEFRGSFQLDDLAIDETRYLIDVEGDADALLDRLGGRALQVEERARPDGIAMPRRRFLVHMAPGEGAGELLSAARATGAQLRRVHPLAEDLEAMFDRVMQDGAAR